MATLGSLLGINTKSMEINEQKVSEGFLVPSGVYKAQVDRAYVYSTDSGAKMLMLELNYFREDGTTGKLSWSTAIQSGDAKGNKSTYVDKSGKKRPLPGVISLEHFLQACGTSINNVETRAGMIEVYGTQKEVTAMPGLTGCKLTIGVTQYENEWNGDVSIKNDVIAFLDENGKNAKGEELVEKLVKRIERNPLKKLKKKEEAAQGGGSEDAKKAISGW